MADEISQVVELEYKGIYYLIKGTKDTITFLAQMIKKFNDWEHQKFLKKPGSCSWQKLQEASEGNAVILEFPKEMFEESVCVNGKMTTPFDFYCQQNDLRFCVLPDLNENDDYVPVGIVSQDMSIHQEQIKAFMNKRIENEEAKDKNYDELITKAKDKVANARSDKERSEAEAELKALEEAKEQNGNLLQESKEKLEKDNVLEFAEYLKQGEGTKLKSDPDATLAEAQTCGVIKEFMPDECMYPIRDEGLVPESKEVFYSQRSKDDKLYTIKRTFQTDEEGLVYSTYEVKNQDEPSIVTAFSDKGFSQEAWKEQLPIVLEESGLIANAPTTAIRSEERLKAYISGLDRNFSDAPKEGQEVVPSSKAAQEFIESAKREQKQKSDYEKSQYTTVTVPASLIMPNGEQVLSLELAEGLVEGIGVESMNSEEAEISVRSDAVYKIEKPDGKTAEISGASILESFDQKKSQSESVTPNVAKAARK